MPKQEHTKKGSPELTRRVFLGGAASGAVAGGLLGGGVSGNESRKYPLVRAAGTHRELGRQHGEQAVERIKAHLDYITQSQKISRERLRERALRFKPLFEKHCPHLLGELEGLAEGARIPLAEALAVNIRGELEQVKDQACTTYVIARGGTARGEILIGQNSDMSPPMIDFGYVLHLKPKDKPPVLIWTFGGMIGYHGMNSAGVAHFANSLGGGPASQFALPHYPLKRLMLERSKVSELVDLFHSVPLASNGNYVLCDGTGNILDIEATTAGPKLLRDEGAGFLAHTNHFLCAPYASRENYDQSVPDSFPRLKRMTDMMKAKLGSISVDDLKRFLSDHSGFPTSICRHQQTGSGGKDSVGRTVASMISEPAQRRMHVAVGNPCESRYVTYSLDA